MIRTALSAMIVLGLSTPAVAIDPENGRKLARQCSVCHGKIGIAKDPEVPNLAGQSAFYTEKSIKDYREGIREDRRMTLVVKNLSDDDIKDLAAWFASIEVVATAPE